MGKQEGMQYRGMKELEGLLFKSLANYRLT